MFRAKDTCLAAAPERLVGVDAERRIKGEFRGVKESWNKAMEVVRRTAPNEAMKPSLAQIRQGTSVGQHRQDRK